MTLIFRPNPHSEFRFYVTCDLSVPRVYWSENPDHWRTAWIQGSRFFEKDHCHWQDAINHAIQIVEGRA